MGQNWTDNCYAYINIGDTDLTAIENNFNCLKSVFGGLAAPSPTASGLRWYDTSHKLHRFYTDEQWLVLMPGDTDQKIWSYCNSVPEGMVSVSMSDRVLALKGGSGSYNTTGGSAGGDWSSTHTHGPGSFTVSTYHRHNGTTTANDAYSFYDGSPRVYTTDYQGSSSQSVAGISASNTFGAAWRPAGSIGILIKPDI